MIVHPAHRLDERTVLAGRYFLSVESVMNQLDARSTCLGANDWQSGGSCFNDDLPPRLVAAGQDKRTMIGKNIRQIARLYKASMFNSRLILQE